VSANLFCFLAGFLQKSGDAMYKKPDKSQPSLLDFNQPLGLRMNLGCQTQAPFDVGTLV
jgi:hypothetical protein